MKSKNISEWEGEIVYNNKLLSIRAEYHLDWSEDGNDKIPYVDDIFAFNENYDKVEVDQDITDKVLQVIEEDVLGYDK